MIQFSSGCITIRCYSFPVVVSVLDVTVLDVSFPVVVSVLDVSFPVVVSLLDVTVFQWLYQY